MVYSDLSGSVMDTNDHWPFNTPGVLVVTLSPADRATSGNMVHGCRDVSCLIKLLKPIAQELGLSSPVLQANITSHSIYLAIYYLFLIYIKYSTSLKEDLHVSSAVY